MGVFFVSAGEIYPCHHLPNPLKFENYCLSGDVVMSSFFRSEPTRESVPKGAAEKVDV